MTGGPLKPRDLANHPPALTPRYKSTVPRAPRLPPLSMDAMTGELAGPVFGHDILGSLDHDLTRNGAAPGTSAVGERIIVHGKLIDEDERPVRGALVEIWQANAGGRYRHVRDRTQSPLDPNFIGCGRAITDDAGGYAFLTVRPGAYPWPNRANDWRPAHIHFSLFGHAFAQRLVTQMYFEGDPMMAHCPILNSVPDAACVERLTARLDFAGSVPFAAIAWRFDIVLRGRRATYFENRLEG